MIYVLFFGKSFLFYKYFFLFLENILIYNFELIRVSKLDKIFKIRIKIYLKSFKYNLIFDGCQFFLKTYENINSDLIFEFKNGQLIDNKKNNFPTI